MTTVWSVLLGLVIAGIFLFGLSILYAHLEERRWKRMSMGEKLERFQKVLEKRKDL